MLSWTVVYYLSRHETTFSLKYARTRAASSPACKDSLVWLVRIGTFPPLLFVERGLSRNGPCVREQLSVMLKSSCDSSPEPTCIICHSIEKACLDLSVCFVATVFNIHDVIIVTYTTINSRVIHNKEVCSNGASRAHGAMMVR